MGPSLTVVYHRRYSEIGRTYAAGERRDARTFRGEPAVRLAADHRIGLLPTAQLTVETVHDRPGAFPRPQDVLASIQNDGRLAIQGEVAIDTHTKFIGDGNALDGPTTVYGSHVEDAWMSAALVRDTKIYTRESLRPTFDFYCMLPLADVARIEAFHRELSPVDQNPPRTRLHHVELVKARLIGSVQIFGVADGSPVPVTSQGPARVWESVVEGAYRAELGIPKLGWFTASHTIVPYGTSVDGSEISNLDRTVGDLAHAVENAADHAEGIRGFARELDVESPGNALRLAGALHLAGDRIGTRGDVIQTIQEELVRRNELGALRVLHRYEHYRKARGTRGLWFFPDPSGRPVWRFG